ncbi:cyclic nucleotide-binding domain protein [Leptospira fainei serovar Hurstbridge str. BUT 6]|uniref:Cyclic nucleotide-binding domain protein n=1 Tax=Leptospira fainei serovar Hurstbridge str. BUT 6 TaxID=1193011 RepID=S3VGB2_9LEPT|nr:Crp/Fnr family transcriptional regulator [Leptospira fainei]EPG75500.1 cyclic nucleotide-binding domain protein [Leptospira fainei serovar Hurstbridge str. BUT 6]
MIDLPLIEEIKRSIPGLEKNWSKYEPMLREKRIPAKTVLIQKGEITKTIYIVKKGCLRVWFDDEGKDITIAFIFENTPVASLYSYRGKGITSAFILESLEPTELYFITGQDAERIYRENEGVVEYLLEFAMERFDAYMVLFLSRIRDSPEQRYLNLVKQKPDILARVPQHYIASYLGITPVSLSRIRNRVWKEYKL